MTEILPRRRRAPLYARPKASTLLALSVLASALAGCASAGGVSPGLGGGDVSVVGDEKGGKIANGVGEGGRTAASMQAVTAHCAKYGKKAFVTQMEAPTQGGLVAFVCLDRS
jgi:hypothetical protein